DPGPPEAGDRGELRHARAVAALVDPEPRRAGALRRREAAPHREPIALNRREALAALSGFALMPLPPTRSRHGQAPAVSAAAVGAGTAAKPTEVEAAKLLDSIGEN